MSYQRYPDELKQHILDEHAQGVSVSELARRYEPTAATIHTWLRMQSDLRLKDVASEQRSQQSLEQEIARLREEVAFLKKATRCYVFSRDFRP